MGFSISNLNPTSLLSNAAESLCDAVLPDNLEFLGDLAGLAVDFQSGNYLKCLEDLQDLAQDLPQQLAQFAQPQSQSQSQIWATGTGGRSDDLMMPTFLEPSPPPPYRAASNTQTTTTTTTTITNGAVFIPAPNTLGPAGGFNANVIPSPSNQGHLPWPHQWTQTVVAPVVRGTPAPSMPIHASPSAAPAFGSTGGLISSQPSPLSSSASASSGSAGTDPFFGRSDAALMEAVRNGQIPESITKDPAKMQQLQARINHISEMNQLISQMMAALHDMMKTVIQNIRA